MMVIKLAKEWALTIVSPCVVEVGFIPILEI
jgi:hypothetical protein